MIGIIVCLLVGYVFGCISCAYIIGKLNHIDIRDYGSGNAGTTNTMRTLGKKAGIITYLGDVLKVCIAIFIMWLVFKDSMDTEAIKLITGFGVVIGHNYPFWLNFKGGKGIAVTSGVILVYDPIILIICLLSFVLVVYTTKYVSVGSLTICTLFSVYVAITARGSRNYTELLIFAVFFTLSAFYTHRANLKRLMNGTENKIGSKKKPDDKEKVKEEAE